MTTMAIEPGRFTCPVCDQRFKSVGGKKQHIKINHPRD